MQATETVRQCDQNFLINTKDQLIIQLKPGKKEKQGHTVCWLEAYKIIKNGRYTVPEELELNEKKFEVIASSFVDKSKQIFEIRQKLLHIFKNTLTNENLPGIAKIFSQLNEHFASQETGSLIPFIHELFTDPEILKNANGDILKAIQLNSYIKLNTIYQEFIQNLGTNPKDEWGKYLQVAHLPARKWEELNFLQKWKVISIIAIRACYKGYGFKESKWNPGHSITNLIQELKDHGPLFIIGPFGKDFYEKPPFELKTKIEERSVWGWTPQEYSHEEMMKNGKESHSVVIIGAKVDAKNQGYVYFVDPRDQSDSKGELPIYVMSLDGLRKRIPNLWNEVLFDNDKKAVFVDDIPYAVYSK